MRVVFLGTPEFAVPSLDALGTAGYDLIAVFTQPDRPKGRGSQIAESPVKKAATAMGLPVLQPERIRRPDQVEQLRSLAPDLMVVVGYGQIIPQGIIDIPRHGILNVHASLLPRHRGAAPIQWAIANGERTTGVTIMQIDAGLDTGDMLMRQELDILPDETALELSGRLAPLGAELLIEAIRNIERGESHREKQDDAHATLARILKKEDGLIDWNCPAKQIYDRLRGFTPWPGAYTSFRGQQLSIVRARPSEGASEPVGVMVTEKRRLLVGCGESTLLELMEVQLAGKRPMSSDAFLNGYKLTSKEELGG